MRIVFLSLFISLFSSFLFSGGKADIPTSFISVGELDFTSGNRYSSLSLPYKKPFGINEILTSSVIGLIIDEIIVDGKTIKPKKTFLDMGAYEATSYSYEKEVDQEENDYNMPMGWGVYGSHNKTYDEQINEGIYFNYYSRNGKIRYSPDKYIIPYGSSEVYIKYRIRFPNYSSDDSQRFQISEEYTGKFTISWPVIRVADKEGNIDNPADFINLGEYDISHLDYLSVNLPFIKHKSDYETHIKHGWIKIYELVADNRIILPRRASSSEIRNVNSLFYQKDELISESLETEMIFLKKEDGLYFYFNDGRFVKYIIPLDSKEVYMTYDIIFHGRVGYSVHNDRLCVGWRINW